MKTETIPEPEPGQAILQTYIEGQDTPFYVHGDVEVIEGLYAAVKDKTWNVPAQPKEPAVAAPVQPREAILPVYHEPGIRDKVQQYFADAHVRRFDRAYGSNLYGELLEKRRRDALFLKASQIGLLGQDSLYYKRKLGQLAKGV